MELKCIGYHGTNASNEESIITNGFIPSKPNNWLGSGVYFFADLLPWSIGADLAKNWAVKNKRFLRWIVFKAEIESDKYLDIWGDNDHIKEYHDLKQELFLKHRESGKDIRHFKENIVLIAIAKIRKFDFIRAEIDPSGPSKPYVSYIVCHSQIQLCVTNNKCINIIK